jgi:hypothetical protein
MNAKRTDASNVFEGLAIISREFKTRQQPQRRKSAHNTLYLKPKLADQVLVDIRSGVRECQEKKPYRRPVWSIEFSENLK